MSVCHGVADCTYYSMNYISNHALQLSGTMMVNPYAHKHAKYPFYLSLVTRIFSFIPYWFSDNVKDTRPFPLNDIANSGLTGALGGSLHNLLKENTIISELSNEVNIFVSYFFSQTLNVIKSMVTSSHENFPEASNFYFISQSTYNFYADKYIDDFNERKKVNDTHYQRDYTFLLSTLSIVGQTIGEYVTMSLGYGLMLRSLNPDKVKTCIFITYPLYNDVSDPRHAVLAAIGGSGLLVSEIISTHTVDWLQKKLEVSLNPKLYASFFLGSLVALIHTKKTDNKILTIFKSSIMGCSLCLHFGHFPHVKWALAFFIYFLQRRFYS